MRSGGSVPFAVALERLQLALDRLREAERVLRLETKRADHSPELKRWRAELHELGVHAGRTHKRWAMAIPKETKRIVGLPRISDYVKPRKP